MSAAAKLIIFDKVSVKQTIHFGARHHQPDHDVVGPQREIESCQVQDVVVKMSGRNIQSHEKVLRDEPAHYISTGSG